MTVTPADLKTKFSALSSVVSSDLQTWIDEAERNVCRTAWGARADDGVSYLAAHLYQVFGTCGATVGGGESGPLTSKRVDQIAATYAVGDAFKNEDLGTTVYGRRFISIRRLIFPPRCI